MTQFTFSVVALNHYRFKVRSQEMGIRDRFIIEPIRFTIQYQAHRDYSENLSKPLKYFLLK